jgi:hypothetical protein
MGSVGMIIASPAGAAKDEQRIRTLLFRQLPAPDGCGLNRPSKELKCGNPILIAVERRRAIGR